VAKKVTAFLPVFGGNRTNAERPGELLGKCDWIGVPFAGGMPEVPYLQARSIVVNDLHRHIVNCARACRDYSAGMVEYLEQTIFHPDELAKAQKFCKDIDLARFVSNEDISAEVEGSNGCHFGSAVRYFITQWMGRSGNGSTDKEFTGNLSTRWNANGGDSNTRFRSATNAIHDFAREFQRCNFVCLDFRKFLSNVSDTPGTGLYCDPPWPDLGAEYRHAFTEQDQVELSNLLVQMKHVRIVMRFGDHPVIRSLYSQQDGWQWIPAIGKTQGNNKQTEWFITRRCGRES
jgi:DNA adenine methylase